MANQNPAAGLGPVTVPGDVRTKTIGRYRLVRLLGAGGMGQVHEAYDPFLQRLVALKLLAPELAQDADARQQFLREARAAAQINHPHVITVHEVNQIGGTVFLAMELAEGSLQDLLKSGQPLDWREATRLLAEACAGLAAAHAARLIHRDLKPGNLLRVAGRVKLADFGLVKRAGTATTSPGAGPKGTPDFMAPEQCRAEPADARSDLYALGTTYYYLLTGQAPFVASNAFEVMFAHCSHPVPDPRERVADLPAACSAIVLRAMAKEPADRYPTADALLIDLRALLAEAEGPPTQAHSLGPAVAGTNPTVPLSIGVPPRRRRAIATAAGLVLLALILGGLGMRWWHGLNPGDPSAGLEQRIPDLPADGVRLQVGRRIRSLACTPSGTWLAAALLDRGEGRRPEGGVWLYNLETGAERTLERPDERVRAVAFAPGGKQLFAGTGVDDEHGQLYRIDAVHDPAPVWTPARSERGNYRALALTADGNRLAALRTFGSAHSVVELWDPATLTRSAQSPSWAGYGDVVAFASGSQLLAAGGKDGQLRLWEGPSKPLRTLSAGEAIVGLTLGHASTQLLVARQDRLEWWDLNTQALLRRITLSGEARSLTQTPDGRLLAVGLKGGVVLLDAETGEERQRWKQPRGEAWAVAFVRGGAWLAAGVWPDSLVLWDVRPFQSVLPAARDR